MKRELRQKIFHTEGYSLCFYFSISQLQSESNQAFTWTETKYGIKSLSKCNYKQCSINLNLLMQKALPGGRFISWLSMCPSVLRDACGFELCVIRASCYMAV